MVKAMEMDGAVRQAEGRRCAAMLANDATALNAILDPRLYFSHATGQVDDKAAYIAKIAAGRIEYLSIDWTGGCVIALGPDAAALTGRMISRLKVDGVEKRLDNRVLANWVRDETVWLLVAFQSTPIKG